MAYALVAINFYYKFSWNGRIAQVDIKFNGIIFGKDMSDIFELLAINII